MSPNIMDTALERSPEMTSSKTTAGIVGALLIAATAASLLGTILTSSIVGAPDYLVQLAAHQSQVTVGVLLKFVAALGSVGIAIALYPVLRKHGEGLALGSVAFRIIEGVFYLVAALSLLALLSLSQEYVSAGSPAASTYQILGTWTLAVRDWAAFVFGVIPFCLGASMYYYALYRSRLIPRWLSGWGLVGLAMLFSMVLLIMFGQKSAGITLVLAVPIGLQEMVLAVWLILKGFNPSAIASGSTKTDTD